MNFDYIMNSNIVVDSRICKDIKSKNECGISETTGGITEKNTIKELIKDLNTEVNITIKSCKNITSKQALLIIPITKFFLNREKLHKLITILKGESISLRLIDWFVTNYCKKYNIILINQNNSNIIVHIDYKNQLKAYAKIYFDPFCRRDRINFIYGKGNELLTTVGQLNFFRWAIENNIIEYTLNNLDIIEKDMNISLKFEKNIQASESSEVTEVTEVSTETTDELTEVHTNNEKKEKRRRKRHELSVSAARSVSRHNVSIVVDFS